VVIGDHDQTTTSEAPSVTKAVAAILPHEYYDKTNYTNDIALLQLISPVNFADNIKPVCLPPAGKYATPLFERKLNFFGRFRFLTVWRNFCRNAGPSRQDRRDRRLGQDD
jgi:Trypsin